MARLPFIQEADAAPIVREAMASNRSTHGQVLPSTGLYGYAPTILRGTRELDKGITEAGRIPQQLRFLVNVRVASLVGCPF
jgi:hypothetical protein